ncbi:hypothetical protein [Natronobacterium texcoconense]|uniref:Uncharacterized protein n=1 Tax=Natronobacterium texcoconense TaxID=1095778 RepID=A0A1H1I0M6_NATTX|nr:hypothetical protein [Natronobacterium texcoconense]SDR30896.1 hypothetical protein SAMN04489842_3184 [Natronobacterium texcoconense]
MSGSRGSDSDRSGVVDSLVLVGEEFRRRNASATAVDVLYVFTTAFLATLAIRGFWPAMIAALPLATMLYFAWNSSKPFFVANLLVIGLTVVATRADLMPL